MRTCACLLAALILALPFTARAHEGEEEKPAAPVQMKSGQTTLFAQSDNFELVIKYETLLPSKESKMKIFLSDYATNAPVAGAQIQIDSAEGNVSVKAQPAKDPGIYTATMIFSKKGSAALTFDITAKDKSDLLSMDNVKVGLEEEKRASARKGFSGTLKKMSAGIILLCLAWLFLSRRRKKARRES